MYATGAQWIQNNPVCLRGATPVRCFSFFLWGGGVRFTLGALPLCNIGKGVFLLGCPFGGGLRATKRTSGYGLGNTAFWMRHPSTPSELSWLPNGLLAGRWPFLSMILPELMPKAPVRKAPGETMGRMKTRKASMLQPILF